MIRRVKIIFIIISFGFHSKLVAQSNIPKVSVGIDLFRSFPTYFQSGYTFEPSLVSETNKGLIFDLAFGITSVANKSIYNNINAYRNDGRYFRFSVRKSIGENFYLGIGIGHSSFAEKGEVYFPDVTFGSYNLNLNQDNSLVFIEPTLSYQFSLSPRFVFIPQFRVAFVMSPYNDEKFPVYSVPGVGYMRAYDSQTGSSSKFTTALSARLTYKISKN